MLYSQKMILSVTFLKSETIFTPMTTVKTDANTIRILVVDDRFLIRETIQMYLKQERDLEVVGHAENGTEALKQIENLSPDVVILDLEMPDMDGLTTTKIIRERFNSTKVLVLSSHDDRDRLHEAIEAGAKGYLIKGTPANELVRAIRCVNQGYFQLGPGLMEKLIISLSHNESENTKSLEEKLVIALKKFKQDTNKQLSKLVETQLNESKDDLEQRLELRIHRFKKKHNDLYIYVRQVEFKLYLLLFLQGLFLFGVAIVWVLDF